MIIVLVLFDPYKLYIYSKRIRCIFKKTFFGEKNYFFENKHSLHVFHIGYFIVLTRKRSVNNIDSKYMVKVLYEQIDFLSG